MTGPPRREIVPIRLHLRHSHLDVEGYGRGLFLGEGRQVDGRGNLAPLQVRHGLFQHLERARRNRVARHEHARLQKVTAIRERLDVKVFGLRAAQADALLAVRRGVVFLDDADSIPGRDLSLRAWLGQVWYAAKWVRFPTLVNLGEMGKDDPQAASQSMTTRSRS